MQGWAHILLPKTYHMSAGEEGAFPAKPQEKHTLAHDGDASDADSEATCSPDGTESHNFGTSTWSTSGLASTSISRMADFRDTGAGSASPMRKTAPRIEEEETALSIVSKAALSVGSADHAKGTCRPCAWFHKPQGCANGRDCRHCHLCDEGEIKSRKQSKVASLREVEPRGESEAPLSVHGSQVSAKAVEENHAEELEPPPGLATNGLSSLPSVGSARHRTGTCRPCAWFYKEGGCVNCAECRHCHLCPEGELKLRKKDKVVALRKKHNQQEGDGNEPQSTWPVVSDMGMPRFISPYDIAQMAMQDIAQMAMHGLSPLRRGMSPSLVPPIILPSVGSGLHGTGICRPCAWFWKAQGCSNGEGCFHCHFCPEGEIAGRKKMKLAVMRVMNRTTSAPDRAEEQTTTPSRRTRLVVASTPVEKTVAEVAADAPAAEPVPPRALAPAARVAADDLPMSVPLPQYMELASTGSALHASGKCRPCAWFWKASGCQHGRACAHCHLCPEAPATARRRRASGTSGSRPRRPGALAPASPSGSLPGQAGARAPRLLKLAPTLLD